MFMLIWKWKTWNLIVLLTKAIYTHLIKNELTNANMYKIWGDFNHKMYIT